MPNLLGSKQYHTVDIAHPHTLVYLGIHVMKLLSRGECVIESARAFFNRGLEP